MIGLRSVHRIANVLFNNQRSTTFNLNRKLGSVPLTSEKYNVQRGDFNKLCDADINFFKKLLGDRVVTEESDLEFWNTDWLKTVKGQSKIILKPKTTEEISKILQFCNNKKLAVCPQGGNTGLVGGSVPVFDEIILSTSLMNNIISTDINSGIMVCQAGCILQNLNTHLEDYKMVVPLDLGAKGSCHIGGNLSTNAGGLRLLRYGSLKGNVMGIEAVLADGTVLDSLDIIRKNNTGYDLKQLFVGSEGTLGVITAASILCPQKSKSVQVSFLGVDSFENLVSLLRNAKEHLGEILSAVEFEDDVCMGLVQNQLGLKNPIGDHPFYMLIETSGSNEQHDAEKLEQFLELSVSSGLASDGTLATDFTKMDAIWQLRERLAEALLLEGYTYKYDISLPTSLMYEAVHAVRKRLEPLGNSFKTVCGYGHLGDGNLHLNVTSEFFDPDILSKLEPFLFEYTVQQKGSISAEHGIGFKKAKYIGLNQSDESLAMMKSLKKLLDPNMILNPYKVLPP